MELGDPGDPPGFPGDIGDPGDKLEPTMLPPPDGVEGFRYWVMDAEGAAPFPPAPLLPVVGFDMEGLMRILKSKIVAYLFCPYQHHLIHLA